MHRTVCPTPDTDEWQECHVLCEACHIVAVDLLTFAGSGPTSVAVTVDAFEAANRLAPEERGARQPPFRLRLLTPGGGDVVLRGGLRVPAEDLQEATPAPWVIVAGLGAAAPGEMDERLGGADIQAAARWLRGAIAHGSQVAASCTGVFVVGEAGGLDGRRSTTTWWLGGLLVRRYPLTILDPDRVVVHDGAIRTAGASFAHADLVLDVLDEAGPPGIAGAVASRLLIPRRQSQVPYRHHGAHRDADPVVAAVEAFATAHLDRPLPLAELARAAHVSPRTLARRFHTAHATTPARYVQRLRVEAALSLIGNGPVSLGEVATRVGYADAPSVSRAIRRHTGQAPGAFRAGSC